MNILKEYHVKFSLQQHTTIKWGSKIQTSLDFEWSKRGWVANGLDFEWDLKSGQMAAILSKPFEIRTKISGFWMVETIALAIAKARPFKIRPLKSLIFKCFRISNGQISDPHCLHVFPLITNLIRIRTPTSLPLTFYFVGCNFGKSKTFWTIFFYLAIDFTWWNKLLQALILDFDK